MHNFQRVALFFILLVIIPFSNSENSFNFYLNIDGVFYKLNKDHYSYCIDIPLVQTFGNKIYLTVNDTSNDYFGKKLRQMFCEWVTLNISNIMGTSNDAVSLTYSNGWDTKTLTHFGKISWICTEDTQKSESEIIGSRLDLALDLSNFKYDEVTTNFTISVEDLIYDSAKLNFIFKNPYATPRLLPKAYSNSQGYYYIGATFEPNTCSYNLENEKEKVIKLYLASDSSYYFNNSGKLFKNFLLDEASIKSCDDPEFSISQDFICKLDYTISNNSIKTQTKILRPNQRTA